MAKAKKWYIGKDDVSILDETDKGLIYELSGAVAYFIKKADPNVSARRLIAINTAIKTGRIKVLSFAEIHLQCYPNPGDTIIAVYEGYTGIEEATEYVVIPYPY